MITLNPKSVTKEGWKSLSIGLGLSIILILVNPLTVMFHGFGLLVHELGHTITHWLFGRPAIPTINFMFGGGLTLVFDHSPFVISLVYLAIAFLFYLCRFYPRLQGILVLFVGVYTWCLLTPTNVMLSTWMGHGMEAISIVVCLYLSGSGYFCRMIGDRTIYAMLGFFTLFSNIQFAWKLIYDVEFRDWYEDGKGGMLDNDLTILANDYFHINLSVIAGFFLICCLLAPVFAFLLFRFEELWCSWIETLLYSK